MSISEVKDNYKNVSDLVDSLKPINDTFAKKLFVNTLVCEELIRVIMSNKNIIIRDNEIQNTIHNIDTRSVILDLKCYEGDSKVYCVEFEDNEEQDKHDHQRRTRYNGACIQVQELEKRAKFAALPDICMIYITSKDIFGYKAVIGNESYRHIMLRVNDYDCSVEDNGYTEIYLNIENAVKRIDDDSDLAAYLRILGSSEVPLDDRFPHLCEKIKYYKEGEGYERMCQIMDRCYKRAEAQNTLKIAKKMLKNGCSIDMIKENTELSADLIKELMTTMNEQDEELLATTCEHLAAFN